MTVFVLILPTVFATLGVVVVDEVFITAGVIDVVTKLPILFTALLARDLVTKYPPTPSKTNTKTTIIIINATFDPDLPEAGAGLGALLWALFGAVFVLF